MSTTPCQRCGLPQKLIGPRCECGESDGPKARPGDTDTWSIGDPNNPSRDDAMSGSEEGAHKNAGQWRRGLPPGKYYPGMEKDFEVYFSPAGQKWHRRRSSNMKVSESAP